MRSNRITLEVFLGGLSRGRRVTGAAQRLDQASRCFARERAARLLGDAGAEPARRLRIVAALIERHLAQRKGGRGAPRIAREALSERDQRLFGAIRPAREAGAVS